MAFDCPTCGAAFVTRSGLRRHCRSKHLLKKPARGRFICCWCNVTFKGLLDFHQHTRLHHKVSAMVEEFVCCHCGEVQTSQLSLEQHMLEQHAVAPSDKKRSRSHICGICEQSYTLKKHLVQHVRACHPGSATPIRGVLVHQCSLCSWSGATARTLRRHQHEVHGTRKQRAQAPCMMADCSYSASTAAGLRSHLHDVHSYQMDDTTMGFDSLRDFYAWRHSYECDNEVRFTVRSRRRGVIYFSCHRSGVGGKSSSCVRTGRLCTAFIRVQLPNCPQPAPVSILACLEHHGHTDVLETLRLSHIDRQRIVVQHLRSSTVERYAADLSALERHLIDVCGGDVPQQGLEVLQALVRGLDQRNVARGVLKLLEDSNAQQRPTAAFPADQRLPTNTRQQRRRFYRRVITCPTPIENPKQVSTSDRVDPAVTPPVAIPSERPIFNEHSYSSN